MNAQPETVLLPVDAIDIGDRLRVVDDDYAQLLASSIEDVGLMQPIEVGKKTAKGRYPLIAGAHRLTAFRRLGLAEIPAVVVTASKLQAQLREIDENLMRRELTPLDRATFLAKRKEVYEALHPETKHGGDRKSEQVAKSGDLVARFTAEIAAKLDLSERSVQRAIQRYSRIAPDVRERIATTWLARKGAMLDAIAGQEPALQRAIVAQLLAEENAPKTVAAALERIHGAAAAPKAAGEAPLFKAWKKAKARERAEFLEFIAAEGLVFVRGREGDEKLGAFAQAVQHQLDASRGEAA